MGDECTHHCSKYFNSRKSFKLCVNAPSIPPSSNLFLYILPLLLSIFLVFHPLSCSHISHEPLFSSWGEFECTDLGNKLMSSSGQVDLSRHFHFKYAKKTLPEDVIPIISANMDTIGTFEMAIALSQVT